MDVALQGNPNVQVPQPVVAEAPVQPAVEPPTRETPALVITEAAEMLMEKPEISIYEIARKVGMTDKSNFRREFEVHTGLKPADWREYRGSLGKYRINSLKARAGNHFPSLHKNS